MSTTNVWLREGQRKKLRLHVAHDQLEDAGSFAGGAHKIVWHTTEGGTVASVVQTLRSKRAGVHFVIDPRTGETVQCVPLNRAGRGLEHPSGPETNRANAIQVETVGFASQTGSWGDREYRNLAALAVLIERNFGVPRRVRNFTRPRKFTGLEFYNYGGHCGHIHVPGNTHYDPGTGFKGRQLLAHMDRIEPR